MINKLVVKNLRANKKENTTFILSNALVYAMIFVLYTLTKNEYVLSRNQHLISIMQFGVFVLSGIAIVFTLYSQRFMFKKRARELSLYQVLGLEKKHISAMLSRESLFIFMITTVLTGMTGYTMGVVSFLLHGKILNFNLKAFDIFEFNIWALRVTIGILAFSFILNLIVNVLHIAKKTPAELIRYEKESEKEPKVRLILLILGLITLTAGYGIALTVDDPMGAIVWLFAAVLLVMMGTYCLFTSLSILVLKMMRKNKKYYFKKENFLSISNLLYRLKSNAVSLATITILCSGVILTISVSYSIGQGLKNAKIDYDYQMMASLDEFVMEEREINHQIEELDHKINSNIDKKYFVTYSTAIQTTNDGKIVFGVNPQGNLPQNLSILTITSKAYFEKAFDESLDHLEEDELYYVSTKSSLNHFDKIDIAGKTYKVKYVEDKSDKRIALDKTFVITKDFNTLKEIVAISSAHKNIGLPSGTLNVTVLINQKDGQDLSEYLEEFAVQSSMDFLSQKEQWEFLQGFSGGIFFLSILLSIVLTVITSLVLYYKQISEAEEDRNRYLILKKLGVSEKIATKTIRRQMRSVFLSPIIVAVIHNIVGSKIISAMLRLFGIGSHWNYFKNLILVSAIFVLVYLVAYKLSQNAYKTIVWNDLNPQ